MTALKRILLTALLGALLALAGCGGDEDGEPIPADAAQALLAELDKVQERLNQGSAGACRDILEAPEARGPSMPRVQELIDSLPDDVDADVRAALEDSFDRLWDQVQEQCDEKAQREEEERPAPEPEPEVTETEAEPPPTETEEDKGKNGEEVLPPEEETLPPEGDGNNEGAIPGGEGGGVGPSSEKPDREKSK